MSRSKANQKTVEKPDTYAEAVITWRRRTGSASTCACGHIVVVDSQCPFCKPHVSSVAVVEELESEWQAAMRKLEAHRRVERIQAANEERKRRCEERRKEREAEKLAKASRCLQEFRDERAEEAHARLAAKTLDEAMGWWSDCEGQPAASDAATKADWAVTTFSKLVGKEPLCL